MVNLFLNLFGLTMTYKNSDVVLIKYHTSQSLIMVFNFFGIEFK
jgi:hypothetical protein